MFDFTKAAIKKTIDDFKKVTYLTNVLTQLVYLVYLVYAFFFGNGNPIVSGILAGISLVYFLFFLIATKFGKAIDGRENLKRPVAFIYRWSKRLIALYNIGVMLYGLTLTAKSVTPFALIMNAMMIVGFLLGVVFEVIGYIVKKRAQLFIDGFEEDIAVIKQPVKNVGNFFKKMTGQEIEEEAPKSKSEEKNLRILQAIADKTKAEEKQKKLQKITNKKFEKMQKIQAKKDAKVRAKQVKNLSDLTEEIAPSEGKR
ncbi:MAG: hypothetical protein IJX81_04510 [Clostridia bacterium]|nr:hypothetical protein [Clostridia bacterium]